MMLWEQKTRWEISKSKSDKKRAQKQFKALEPISLKCGNSFILKSDTKTTYYQALVDRTVNGLLL